MFLEKIVLHKKAEIEQLKSTSGLDTLIRKVESMSDTRNFCKAISNGDKINIIAEIKKASPSKGTLAENMNIVEQARIYEENGASAISVLTDQKFFCGSLADLTTVKEAVKIPVLRKDFILDPIQVYESRAAGADAILLIAAILSTRELESFYRLARDLEMHVLVEVHNSAELRKVLPLNPAIIGINNRNLQTFEVDIINSLMLLPLVPEGIRIVSESGISSRKDISILHEAGISAFLIGEALVRSSDPGQKLSSLIN